MPGEEELEEFLRGVLLPEVARLRCEYAAALARRRALQLPWPVKAAIWVPGVALVLAFAPDVRWLALVIAIPWLLDQVRMRKVPLPSGADAKQCLLRRLVAFHDPEFGYAPRGRIPRSEFEASRLFDARIDRYAGEDLLTGKVGGTAFRMSELRVERRRGKRNGRAVYERVFSGLFLLADFPKEVKGPLYVLPDGTERHLGALLGRALQSLPLHGRGPLVELESPAFERHFKVYGRDPIETRRVLTPAFMRRLVRFREATKQDVRLVVQNGALALALPLPGDLFGLRSPAALDLALLRSWAIDLQFAVGILEELDLVARAGWRP